MSTLTVYTDEELKAIQALELDALKELIRVCDILDVDYFLMDGAALGAVRHGGFIPWDDDIDVGMVRSDYMRFVEEAPRLLDSKYYLQTPYGEVKSPYLYSKLRINGTRFVEYCNRKLKTHQGVYIDICPFDEVPDDERLNKRQFKRCKAIIRLFSIRQSPDLSAKPQSIKRRLLAVVRVLLHALAQIVPYRAIVSVFDATSTRYNGTGQQALAFLQHPKRKTDYMLRSDLYGLAETEFSGIKVKVPRNCDAYLRCHYGDYNVWPELEMRYGHKPYEVVL